jgi:hypothetical protein
MSFAIIADPVDEGCDEGIPYERFRTGPSSISWPHESGKGRIDGGRIW